MSTTRGTHLVIDPKHDLVTFARELHKLESLLQFESLLPEFGQQQFPQAVQLFQTGLKSKGKVSNCLEEKTDFRLNSLITILLLH